MTEPEANLEDLEDGEIESDGEQINEVQYEEKKEETTSIAVANLPPENTQTEEKYHKKSGKKKKSKAQKREQKLKDKKARKLMNSGEEDFAGKIEKAIKKALNKNADGEPPYYEDIDERRKNKKRKKFEGKEGPNKKRMKPEYSEDMDESEMMCVRGASPPHRHSPDGYNDDDRDSYASDSSHESRGHQQQQQQQQSRPQRHRPQQRDRKNNNKNDRDRRRGGAHPNQDPDGVCLYFMQGKCHKGDSCMYSHDAHPPRKMELCKFYLMDCCAKRDKCLYMHADFPCKYYHTGLPCIYKDECKFAHGVPLTENIKNILLKHIESAPKEILGDFPRLNREGALKMIQNTQMTLHQQFSDNSDVQNIPSLFEFNVQRPHNSMEQSKISPKTRQSRWHNDNSIPNFNSNMSPNSNTNNGNILSIKNLTGVLTPRQISDLTKMGIENLDQLGQLTVLQLNSLGISMKQISEIQQNTMNIQKLGLMNQQNDQLSLQTLMGVSKDLDLRVPPQIPVAITSVINAELLPEKDVDMRFRTVTVPKADDVYQRHSSAQVSKDMIDIDQYTKDALKFASKDKENINVSNDSFENEKPMESKDVDHRVLPFAEEETRPLHTTVHIAGKQGTDTDIRFLHPEPIFKSPEQKRSRRYTTDDEEESNLLIDEKWYSSDEEKSSKKKSPAMSPNLMSPPQISIPHVIEPSTVIRNLGDLSKIDISHEVTKLLHTMKNNLHDIKTEPDNKPEEAETSKSRDPRSRRSPEKVVTKDDTSKSTARKPKVSIYECIEGEPTDGRRRTDVDLRQTDFTVPNFGDTDLRPGSSGDIDFRFGLPFKPIPNHTPASEIDGSFNSHPPISYKLVTIDIPRPDYTDIRNSTAKSQALTDPRLRKVFRLSLDESGSDSEKPPKTAAANTPRVDPRRKPKEPENSNQDQKPPSLDLQIVLQNSEWYKELSSTNKIFVNQHIATVNGIIKLFQQDRTPGKIMDLAPIHTNPALVNIFSNLGVTLGENGEYSYLPKPKEGLLKTPIGFNQNPSFGLNSNMAAGMDTTNVNMMNMPSMGMGGPMNSRHMGNMPGYNAPFQDPRGGPGPSPGLLGIAPNMPHSFNNFNGPNNFGNMPFNGPGNDFGNMDGDQNYHRFQNRGGMGGHRGRGNERWNRGGGGRGGHRNWKNDRQ